MQIYYPNLRAIHQQTQQLELVPCPHCQQTRQLVSHGFVRKKCRAADPRSVGKRVYCSNRQGRTGCGRTTQLYLDSTLKHMHHAGCALVAFVLSLVAGVSIALAYMQATCAHSPRHAYRWLHRLDQQLSTYRCLFHQPLLSPRTDMRASRASRVRRNLLTSTFSALLMHFAQPLCQTYQSQLQRPFF